MKYDMDTRLRDQLSRIVKQKAKYRDFSGVMTLTGTCAPSGMVISKRIFIKGCIYSKHEGSDGIYCTRFNGKVAPAEATIIDDCIYTEFPITDNWDCKSIARSLAYNLGVVFGFEN